MRDVQIAHPHLRPSPTNHSANPDFIFSMCIIIDEIVREDTGGTGIAAIEGRTDSQIRSEKVPKLAEPIGTAG